MSPRLTFALEAATQAGRFTLAHFQTGVSVDLKSDATPVTVADRGAEQLIRSMIASSFPGEPILGEEEGGDSNQPDRWIVDPIDGTKSFICGVPLYATLLSYEIDFKPILGIAYFPALNELLYAEVGKGAFFNGRPAQVSSRSSLDGSVISCGGIKSMIQNGRWQGFAAISERTLATRSWCDAYGHALVATGRIEAMVDPLVSLWDVSAVALIVEEAGGKCTSFDGLPALSQRDQYEAVSSNGHVHSGLLEAFER